MMLTKKQIRSKILWKLKTQKEEDRTKKSRIIKKKLLRASEFIKAKTVMFYLSFDGEVNTKEMIREAQSLGKIVVVPTCKKDRNIEPCILCKNTRLKNSPYGVYEPVVGNHIKLQDIDLVILPGVAFDKGGKRLGRGRGYYDRFLKRLPQDTPSIGLAFYFQILPSIPATKRDVSVNRVIFA